MPLGHNPHLAGCLGSPVRDPVHLSAACHALDRATTVHLLRPPSQDTSDASDELHIRLNRLAERGVGLFYDLLTGLEPHTCLRFRTADELSLIGRNSRHDPPVPRYLCEELLASVTPEMRAVVDAASNLWSLHPSLNLASLCLLISLPEGTWVRHANTGYFHTIVSSSPGSSILPTTYILSPALTARPDGRLACLDPYPNSLPPLTTPVPRHTSSTTCVSGVPHVLHTMRKSVNSNHATPSPSVHPYSLVVRPLTAGSFTLT